MAVGKKDNKKEKKARKNPLQCPYMSLQEALEKYETSLKGLTREEAERRLEEYGRNELPGKKKITIWKVLFNQLKSPLIFILIAAGILSLIINEYIEAAFIFLVIAINAGLGTFQEWRAEKSAESLQDYLEKEARTIRDGKEVSVLSSRLVPGDIVLIESGDKVPADLRLIESKNLTLDESLLTGESLPVEKIAESMSRESIGEELEFCTNVSLAGTTVTSGRGRGIVISTGMDTEIGKIAEDVYESKEIKPPLLIRIDQFSTKIGFIVLAGAAVLGIITFFQGYSFFEVFFLSIALAVSAIPEGLPVSVTVALSLAANRMAQRNVIIRRLAAVESLGSCTLIASDKTGTLTVNKQTAKKILALDSSLEISGEGYKPVGSIFKEEENDLGDDERQYLKELANVVSIDNEAQLSMKEESNGEEWSYTGDPIDIAFLAMAYKAGVITEKRKEEVEITAEIPFESDIKFSAKFYREKGHKKVAAKGAAEVIIPVCSRAMTVKGKIVGLDSSEALSRAKQLSSEGYRVIAVAGADDFDGRIELKKNPGIEDLPEMTLIAVVGFIDPVRPDVKESVQKAIEAGIKVLMITGDNPDTAFTIASAIGIASEKEELITGHEIEELVLDIDSAVSKRKRDIMEKEAGEKLKNKKVFARVVPRQKLRIVEIFRKIGNFVAVTGDGVNDAPALKAANIGVAMGS
ncbi:MAG: HAD-IC family P-type ATPase, partial [Actinobacteria bacterium]|nr:HAD-IC family P-type ATPase [Actinomycetota bacterium]